MAIGGISIGLPNSPRLLLLSADGGVVVVDVEGVADAAVGVWTIMAHIRVRLRPSNFFMYLIRKISKRFFMLYRRGVLRILMTLATKGSKLHELLFRHISWKNGVDDCGSGRPVAHIRVYLIT